MLRNLSDRSARRPWFTSIRTYLSLGAVRWLDVVHDIDVNVVQDDALLSHSRPLPQNTSEDDTSLCRGNLDGSLDTLKAMWGNGIDRRPLYEFQITQSREV